MASSLIKREWREHSEKKLEGSLLIATWGIENEEMGFEEFGKGSSDWQWELRWSLGSRDWTTVGRPWKEDTWEYSDEDGLGKAY